MRPQGAAHCHWQTRLCAASESTPARSVAEESSLAPAYESMERCTRFFTCFLYSFLSSSLLEKARDAASGLRCVAGSGDGFDASSPTSACVVRTQRRPRVKRRLCAAPGLRCGAQAAQALLYITSALEYGGPPRASVRALREPQVAGSAAARAACFGGKRLAP